jgi:hypothetical protein
LTSKQIRHSTAITLVPERAIPILELQLSRADELRREPYASSKREEWVRTSESALIGSLGDNNPAVELLRVAQTSFTSMFDTPSQLQATANRQLDDSLGAIRSGIEQLRWQLSDPTQVFLPAGSQHDAYLEIKRIVETANAEILVVDNYVDGTLWTLLKNLHPSIKVRVMTMQMQKDFGLEGKKFEAQHKNSVEVRRVGTYHDRFILIDGKTVWHLGASIKDAGNKTFAMSELIGPVMKNAAITDVENTWSGATIVPI